MRIRDAYLVLIVLWFTYFWDMGTQQVIIALLPAVQETLSLPVDAVGLLISLYFAGFAAGFFVSASMCAKLGRARTIGLCVAINALSMLSMSLSTDYLFFLVMEALVGLAAGAYAPAGLSILSDVFSSKSRGRYFGIHEAAVPAGMTVGPIFASLMLDLGLSWKGTFQLWNVPVVIILISQLLLSKVKDEQPLRSSRNETSVTAGSKAGSFPVICLILLVMAQFFRNGASSESYLLPVYWVSVLGATIGTSAFVYGVMRVFSIFGQVAAGYLSDVFGRLRVLLVIQILTAVLLIPTSYLGFGPLLFASFGAFSVFATCYMPVMFALVSDSSQPKDRAKNIGTVMAVGGVSSTISPTILGLLAGTYSFGIAWVYSISGGFIAIPLLLSLRSRLGARPRALD